MSPPQSTWSHWQPLPGNWAPTAAVLAETLDGGQAFRWQQDQQEIWTGVWADCVAQLRLSDGWLEWRAPEAIQQRVAKSLPHYLGLDADWPSHTDALPWRSDAHLGKCLAAFPDLRILRQPFGETLLGFLCSATKQIVQIKQMVALLAERHGSPIGWYAASLGFEALAKEVGRVQSASGTPRSTVAASTDDVPTYSRLPTWSELASIPEDKLRACQLGFRAKYIHETAQFLEKHPGWLDETERLPYAAAKARLVELPGVGEKVADCVLLFGAGKLEAFPVDTWILKALARRYQLEGWKPAQVAQFGRAHFGPLAGYAQQFLFSWERKFGER
jgi:N-glycosylase/DNA lyase